jgi:hypothetical protein
MFCRPASNLYIFLLFLSLSRIGTCGRFDIDKIKYVTISSTVVKRRPAPHLTVASAPQILSPKRLRPTIEEHQQIEQLQQQQQQAFNQLHTLSTLPATTAPIIDSSFINQTALITSSLLQQQQQQQQQQPATTAHLAHLAGLQPAPASSAQPQLISSPSSCVTTAALQTTNSLGGMDNSMALAPLGLSQSMDSVNTASNEEEVSGLCLLSSFQLFSVRSNIYLDLVMAIMFSCAK